MIGKRMRLEFINGVRYFIIEYLYDCLANVLNEHSRLEQTFKLNNLDIKAQVLIGIEGYILKTKQQA